MTVVTAPGATSRSKPASRSLRQPGGAPPGAARASATDPHRPAVTKAPGGCGKSCAKPTNGSTASAKPGTPMIRRSPPPARLKVSWRAWPAAAAGEQGRQELRHADREPHRHRDQKGAEQHHQLDPQPDEPGRFAERERGTRVARVETAIGIGECSKTRRAGRTGRCVQITASQPSASLSHRNSTCTPNRKPICGTRSGTYKRAKSARARTAAAAGSPSRHPATSAIAMLVAANLTASVVHVGPANAAR